MAFARIKPRPSAIATEAPKAISPSPFIRGSSPFELPRIPLLAFAAEKSSIARVLRAEKTSSRKRRCVSRELRRLQNSHDRTFLHTEERFLVLGIPAATSCTHMRARSFVEPNRSSKTRAASSLPDIFLGRAAGILAESRVGLRIRSKNPQPDAAFARQTDGTGEFPLRRIQRPSATMRCGDTARILGRTMFAKVEPRGRGSSLAACEREDCKHLFKGRMI